MANTSELLDFFDRQLKCWPQTAARYEALSNVEIREIDFDNFPIRLQFNPARALSTNAKVDKKSIEQRPCFLCKSNRPSEQIIYPGFNGYDTLVNPFPIFPHHFTIASQKHVNQDYADFREMASIATDLPGLVVFYNGSSAGASAPDHLHFQAGDKDFLPLCSLLEADHGALMYATSDFNVYIPGQLPFRAILFISDYISPLMLRWFDTLLPTDPESLSTLKGMRNLLMWKGVNSHLYTLFLPRAKHRPKCYFEQNGLMVSPGAVDMAGVLILPRRDDFLKITKCDIRNIYDEVSFDYMDSGALKHLMCL